MSRWLWKQPSRCAVNPCIAKAFILEHASPQGLTANLIYLSIKTGNDMKKTMVLLIAGLLSSTTFAYETYTQIGNTSYGSNGSSSTRIGNSSYHSNGSSSTRIGNGIYNSNGSSCQLLGNSAYCNWVISYLFRTVIGHLIHCRQPTQGLAGIFFWIGKALILLAQQEATPYGTKSGSRSVAAIRAIVEKPVKSLADGGWLVFTAARSSHS